LSQEYFSTFFCQFNVAFSRPSEKCIASLNYVVHICNFLDEKHFEGVGGGPQEVQRLEDSAQVAQFHRRHDDVVDVDVERFEKWNLENQSRFRVEVNMKKLK